MASVTDEPKHKDLEGGSGDGGSGSSSPPPLPRQQSSRVHVWEEDVFPELPEAPGQCK